MTTLVVLDFSGTLSLDAVRFAAPDRIAAELRDAGLWSLGIDSVPLFWDRVIHPSWQRGSTTSTGYLTVLADAVAEVLRTRRDDVARETIERCVGAFAVRYFACSTIAPQWRGYLKRLAVHDATTLVVATDHYAEATAHISAELATLGITSAPVAGGAAEEPRIAVANSADLGCHKTSTRYWQTVARALGRHPRVRAATQSRSVGEPASGDLTVSRLVLIDDFGANEAFGDTYADPARVARRHAGASTVLSEVFAVDPDVYPFTLPPDATAGDIQRMVDDAERFTMNVLSRPSD
jgi:hypothetical protein